MGGDFDTVTTGCDTYGFGKPQFEAKGKIDGALRIFRAVNTTGGYNSTRHAHLSMWGSRIILLDCVERNTHNKRRFLLPSQ